MKKILFGLLTILTIFSCQRGEDEILPDDDIILEESAHSYKVDDLKAGEQDTPESATYYNLLKNKEIPYSELTKDNWDLAFVAGGWLVNVYANTNAGAVGVIEKEYEIVKEVPEDIKWITAKGTLGISLNWAEYSRYTGSPEHTLVAYPNKTIIVKTGDGKHYAKIKVKSIYKGGIENPTRNDWDKMGYFTFEYTIQTKDGRKSFGI